jgi:hypothetical protein
VGNFTDKSQISKTQNYQTDVFDPYFENNIKSVLGGTSQYGAPGGQGMGQFMQANNPLFQPSAAEQPWLTKMQDYAGISQDPNRFKSQFLDPLSQNYGSLFSNVVGPELKNYLQVQGQGDSGAFGEYAGRYMSSVGPAIESQGWNQYLQGFGALSAGLGAAAQPRLGSLQNFMNAENIAGQFLAGLPPFNAVDQLGFGRNRSPFSLGDLMGGGGGGMGGSIGGIVAAIAA